MKCPNCGNEFTGKFCTNCGTPAPTEEPAKKADAQVNQQSQPNGFGADSYNAQPAQPNNFGADSYNSQPTQPNNFGADSYNSQPAQPNNFGVGSYNSQPAQSNNFGGNGNIPQQPNGVPSNNGYNAPQFNNAPMNNMPKPPKKGMSGGKIAAIVISIILGILIILGVIIGVVACGIINAVDEGYSYIMDYSYSYSDDSSSYSTSKSESSSSYFDDDEKFDDASCCYYEIDENGEVVITGVNMYMLIDDNNAKKMEVKIPSTIEGKKVTKIYSAYVYNPTYLDDDEVEIIVTVPGSVKKVEEYAFLDCDGLTEIIFEEGVEEFDEVAIVDCEQLKKITVPESVKTIGENSLGFIEDYSTYTYAPAKDLVIVTKKDSEADKFAKKNNIKVEYN